MKKTLFYSSVIFLLAVLFCATSCREERNEENNGIIRTDDALIGDPREDNAADAALDTTVQVTLSYVDNKILKNPATAGASDGPELYEQSAAVKFTAAQLAALDGNRVIRMSAVISKKTTQYSDLVFWIRESLDGENIWSCEHQGEINLGGWTETVAAPYFKLSRANAKDLYFGYTVKADKTPIAGDGAVVPEEGASYIYDNSSSRWVEYTQLGNIYIRAIVSGDNMPSNDMALLRVRAPQYVKKGEKFDAIAIVYNKAVKEGISSFRLIAKEGDNVYAEKDVNLETKLEQGKKATLFIEDLVIDATGIKDLEYKIDRVNCKADDNYDDNTVEAITTEISDKFKTRTVLMENFTGASCKGCPEGHDNLAEAMEKNKSRDSFAWLCHHAGVGADQYTISQSIDSALTFENSYITYAPSVAFDREFYGDVNAIGAPSASGGVNPAFGPAINIAEHNLNGTLAGYMNYARKVASPVDLMVDYSFNSETRNLSVNVSVEPLSFLLKTENLAVGVAVVENGLVGSQTMGNGDINKEYVHNAVLRDCFTSVFAKRLNGNYTLSTSKALDAGWNVDNMEVIVWVGNRPRVFDLYDNYNDCYVYQTFIGKIVK